MSDRDATLERIGSFFEQWLDKHKERRLKQVLGTLKGQVSALHSRRNKNKEWALKMVGVMVEAREDIGFPIGPTALADWLNGKKYRTANGRNFHKSNISEYLYGVDRTLIADAVMECRTKMSALALSADFRKERLDANELEIECINKAKEAIRIARSIEGLYELEEPRWTNDAYAKAIDESIKQRTEYFPMLARECFLTMAEFDAAVPGIETRKLSDFDSSSSSPLHWTSVPSLPSSRDDKTI